VKLALRQGDRGFVLTVHGELDTATIDQLESVLLLEAALEPMWAILDLGAVAEFPPGMPDRFRTWMAAFADAGGQLLLRLPSRMDTDH
jgi:hypothetical protein